MIDRHKDEPETADETRLWQGPEIVKIRAGEAELGANPVIGEGFFGKGS